MLLVDFADNPSAARSALRISQKLFERRLMNHRRIIDEAAVMSVEFETFGVARQRPPAGVDAIYAAGLVQHEGRTAPVLLIDERTIASQSAGIRPLRALPEARHLVGPMQLESEDVLVLPIPEPIPYFAPCESVYSPGRQGTFGATVALADGERLITTAGHVAASGVTVSDAAGSMGTVVWSHDPAVTPAPVAAADIALVRPHAGIDSHELTITGPTAARPGDPLDVRGSLTKSGHSATMGFVPQMYVPSMAGMWGQLYFTTSAASVAGDSGAPVLAAGSSDIVGHVVGGAPGMTSYIQSIDLQLQATGCVLT